MEQRRYILVIIKVSIFTLALFQITYLYSACQKGHLSVVAYLIRQGVNKEARKKNGATPLYAGNFIKIIPIYFFKCSFNSQ